MLSNHQPSQRGDDTGVLDGERLAVLRGLGPDDGWGIFPLIVSAFLHESPNILAAMRHAVETGDAHGCAESAHQLKGAAANVGAVGVVEACQRAEAAISEAAISGAAPLGDQLTDRVADELVSASRLLRAALPDTR